jgi:hypothetical protein
MSTSTWTGAVNTDWDDADNWSPAGVPDASSDVVIAAGAPVAVASASIGTVNSITDSSGLRFRSAGTNTVTTFLDNSGELRVDRKGGGGGTILNIAGALTNSGSLRIGNATLSASDEVTAASIDNTGGGIRLLGSSANQALLDVTGSAGFGTAEVLSGYVWLTGDSAIEFASGQITSLAAHAQLHLNGSDAFIEDSTELGSNSALTGLASIGAAAYFELENGASVSTTGALANDGNVDIDTRRGDGGSSLTVAGTLTNSRTPHTNNGDLLIGNATLSASDKVKAAALDNTGAIELRGSSANQALLDVTGAAGFGTAGVLSGNVALSGDSAIEFASGQITSLAAGAEFGLSLNGNDAFIEDSTALGSNSALTGLASIGAGATLDLEDGASVSTTGSLVNDGIVYLDTNYYFREGRSSLNIGGTLTNSGALLIGNFRLSASDKVKAAALDNANTGNIDLAGSGANQALLDVTASAGFGAAGVLSGYVQLTGDSAIEFASGQISMIAAGSYLSLYGNDALIEDNTALGSNSALTGLASIGAGATLDLEDGASVSTTGSVTNSGLLRLDYYTSSGGSTLSIGGALTNTGSLDIGSLGLSSSDSVTANSFDNSGTVDLTGNDFAALNVSGATTNDGSISIENDTDEFAGAVGGAGSFSLSTDYFYPGATNLQFDSSVSSGQTINEAGEADALTLEQAQKFAATISGFGTGDTIDAANFLLSGTKLTFDENSAMTGGTLTLTDTSQSLTANILMTGVYTKSDFTLAPDHGTGTLVKFA